MVPADPPWPEPEASDPLLRPAWEDSPDETDPLPRRCDAPLPGRGAPALGVNSAELLAPLSEATDALVRLDAGAAAAPPAIHAGLIARMAFAEAAGWLAHAQAWVHPLDLALRDLTITGPAALALGGAGGRALPHTLARPP